MLSFPILEKWSYAGDIPWCPTTHVPLFTRAMCSKGAPYVGCLGPSIVDGLTTMDLLVGKAVPGPVAQSLKWVGPCPCMTGCVAQGILFWHQLACRTSQDPRFVARGLRAGANWLWVMLCPCRADYLSQEVTGLVSIH